MKEKTPVKQNVSRTFDTSPKVAHADSWDKILQNYANYRKEGPAAFSFPSTYSNAPKEVAVSNQLITQKKSITRSCSPQTTTEVCQFSVWSWLKQAGISLFNFCFGTLYRVPKRVLNLVKHLTVDLIKAIYFRCTLQDRQQFDLMQEQSPMLHWLYGLGTKILDILQLRELIGLFATLLGSPLSEIRGLTEEEKDLAREIFGNSMNLSDVSIFEKSALRSPFITDESGAFTVAHTIHGKKSFGDDLERQAVLMHELMHIAQEQKQGILSWIELEWGRRQTRNHPTVVQVGQNGYPDYAYGMIAPDTLFRNFSREQQGAIIQDYSRYLMMREERDEGDAIGGEYGDGSYGDYKEMLKGLKKGHWVVPWQSGDWKKTIG